MKRSAVIRKLEVGGVRFGAEICDGQEGIPVAIDGPIYAAGAEASEQRQGSVETETSILRDGDHSTHQPSAISIVFDSQCAIGYARTENSPALQIAEVDLP